MMTVDERLADVARKAALASKVEATGTIAQRKAAYWVAVARAVREAVEKERS